MSPSQIMFSAREAAVLLGGEAISATSILCPGLGHSPRDRSLSVKLDPDAPDGFIVNSFAGDELPTSWRVARDHVRERLGLPSWRDRDRPPLRPARKPAPPGDEAARIAAALRTWGGARDPRGTLAEIYLASRGLALDDHACAALRFHPALRVVDGAEHRTVPGMVGLFRDLRTDEPCGIHRTFLTPDGRKIDRRMLGRAKDAAIKLDGDDWVELGLAIAEGVETGLAARQLFRPLWALGSAGAIRDFRVLGGMEGLTIFADADDTGQRAAKVCAARYQAAGIAPEDVVIRTAKIGSDANDALRGGRNAR